MLRMLSVCFLFVLILIYSFLHLFVSHLVHPCCKLPRWRRPCPQFPPLCAPSAARQFLVKVKKYLQNTCIHTKYLKYSHTKYLRYSHMKYWKYSYTDRQAAHPPFQMFRYIFSKILKKYLQKNSPSKSLLPQHTPLPGCAQSSCSWSRHSKSWNGWNRNSNIQTNFKRVSNLLVGLLDELATPMRRQRRRNPPLPIFAAHLEQISNHLVRSLVRCLSHLIMEFEEIFPMSAVLKNKQIFTEITKICFVPLGAGWKVMWAWFGMWPVGVFGGGRTQKRYLVETLSDGVSW